jgi:hypothetical protein
MNEGIKHKQKHKIPETDNGIGIGIGIGEKMILFVPTTSILPSVSLAPLLTRLFLGRPGLMGVAWWGIKIKSNRIEGKLSDGWMQLLTST